MKRKKGVETNQVFLVPGQMEQDKKGGGRELVSEISHFVVVANSSEDALALLELKQPNFKPLGFTALSEFEKAVVKIRSALNGTDTEWPLIVQPGIVG